MNLLHLFRHGDCKVTRSMKQGAPTISVILPFRDHEEQIASACRRIASHLEESGQSFEILAVDEGSGDNSQAILSLLRRELPELQVVLAEGRGRGFAAGSQRAHGQLLVLLGADIACERPLAPLGRALRRVGCGELDVVLVEQRLLVCRRSRCLDLVQRCPRNHTERHLLHRARARGLAVESYRLGGDRHNRFRPLDRMLSVLAPRVGGLSRGW